MNGNLVILIVEAMCVYFLVLAAHSLRGSLGRAPFFALLGGLTAIMSWVTDAGVEVEVAGVTFLVGSTVFYTSLLLGVFVVYVFDGPRPTRIAILTVAGVSAMVPIIAVVLHLQMRIGGHGMLSYVPTPSLRINAASVLATIADLVFLAIAWEYLGTPRLKVPLWVRSFLTLLGVMWLDVILFNTGAFLGKPEYLSIMTGTFVSRLFMAIFAFPFLYGYLHWQNRKVGLAIDNRPVLAILSEAAVVREELTQAQQEIERRRAAEAENAKLIEELRQAITEVKTLRGFLPVCAHCKKIRDDEGYWQQIENYIQAHTDAKFSHGICPDCLAKYYPEMQPRDDDRH